MASDTAKTHVLWHASGHVSRDVMAAAEEFCGWADIDALPDDPAQASDALFRAFCDATPEFDSPKHSASAHDARHGICFTLEEG